MSCPGCEVKEGEHHHERCPVWRVEQLMTDQLNGPPRINGLRIQLRPAVGVVEMDSSTARVLAERLISLANELAPREPEFKPGPQYSHAWTGKYEPDEGMTPGEVNEAHREEMARAGTRHFTHIPNGPFTWAVWDPVTVASYPEEEVDPRSEALARAMRQP